MKNFDLPFLIFKYFDKPLIYIVYAIVNSKMVEVSLQREKEYFLGTKTSLDSIDFLNTMLGAIHSRASAAISHISIMMGVTILLITKSVKTPLIQNLMMAEVIFYTFLLLLCLICVRSLSLNDGEIHEDFEEVYNTELVKRFVVLQVINAGLFIATIIFVVLVLAFSSY